MEFVMGKLQYIETSDALEKSFVQGGMVISLIEPILIQRVPGMWNDPKTGQNQMVVTHQFIEDPYWPLHREARMPFRLDDFRTVRILNPDSSKDVEEAKRYDTFLSDAFAKAAGLVKPTRIR
jgi:hypothetical protein